MCKEDVNSKRIYALFLNHRKINCNYNLKFNFKISTLSTITPKLWY